MPHARALARILTLTLALATPQVMAAGTLADLEAGPTSLTFSPRVSYAGLVLTLSGPNDVTLRYHLDARQQPTFPLQDSAGNPLPDGSYTWELRFEPVLDAGTRAALASARQRNDASVAEALRQQGRLPQEPLVQSGSFAILNGLVVAGGKEEASTAGRGEAARAARTGQGGISSLAEGTTLTGDLSVYNSMCVGFDCLSSESYGNDSIRLKENSLRIHFDDTSASPYPNRDWRLLINDTTSGGASYFAIEDSSGSTRPFTVEAGATTDSIHVDTGRRIGFGTATPIASLHAVSNNTPTLRLEQDASSGFTPQLWDIVANESSFFVRDATHSSAIPFRIDATAPNNALRITTTGDVGIGTSSPQARLEIASNELPFGFRITNTATGGAYWDTKQSTSGYGISKNTELAWLLIFDDGRVRLGPGPTSDPTFLLQTNGNLDIGGSLSQNSDVHSKRDFAAVDGAEVLAKVMAMPITTWSFKSDDPAVRHMGPMAQDFFAAFQLGGRDNRLAPVDVGGVSLVAIQELNHRLETELAAKDTELAELRQRLANLEALLLPAKP